MKNISVFGSTGSIGTQTLDVIRMHPDLFRLTGIACKTSIDLLEKQAREFHPYCAVVYEKKQAEDLKVRLADTDVKVFSGMSGLVQMAAMPQSDFVVNGIVGMIGIPSTVAAIQAGKDIALANKETCVTAGHIIMPMAKEKGVRILPTDSEHSAIFQALQGRAGSPIRKILLTASGGPFYGKTTADLEKVTVKETLAHPNWRMGPKITVDSASMVNKGLEVIEAIWLFGVSVDQIEVVIQRESAIHSAVEFEDGSIIAQMAVPDMRIPIQYAMTYPERIPSPAERLDFAGLGMLHFGKPDNDTFRGLPLAFEAIRQGGSMPTAFNAANEWANDRFRSGVIRFTEIYQIIEDAMQHHKLIAAPNVNEIFDTENEINAHLNEKYHLDPV